MIRSAYMLHDYPAVQLYRGRPIDDALRELKKRCQRAAIEYELRRRRSHVPVPAAKRTKSRRARRRLANARA